MTKLVINTCYGGFGLSPEALERLGGDEPTERDNPALVRVVEEMGDAASGECARLRVIEIPDGVDWTIAEYDGFEWVAERHRTWGL